MKKLIAAVLVAGVLGGAMPVNAQSAPMHETMFDRIGDWFATLGKSGMEKDARSLRSGGPSGRLSSPTKPCKRGLGEASRTLTAPAETSERESTTRRSSRVTLLCRKPADG